MWATPMCYHLDQVLYLSASGELKLKLPTNVSAIAAYIRFSLFSHDIASMYQITVTSDPSVFPI